MLFAADGLATDEDGKPAPYVKIAGFDVEANTLTTGNVADGNLIKLNGKMSPQIFFQTYHQDESVVQVDNRFLL